MNTIKNLRELELELEQRLHAALKLIKDALNFTEPSTSHMVLRRVADIALPDIEKRMKMLSAPYRFRSTKSKKTAAVVLETLQLFALNKHPEIRRVARDVKSQLVKVQQEINGELIYNWQYDGWLKAHDFLSR